MHISDVLVGNIYIEEEEENGVHCIDKIARRTCIPILYLWALRGKIQNFDDMDHHPYHRKREQLLIYVATWYAICECMY